jgi:hypothetical protein
MSYIVHSMKVKQKRFLIVGIILAAAGVLGTAASATVASPVAAAAPTCEATYHSSPVASSKAKQKIVELLQSCHQGYDDGTCNGINAGKQATKAEMKKACQVGVAYRAENPPDTTTDGGTTPIKDPVTGTDCGGVQTAIIKCDQNNQDDSLSNNGIWGLLLIAINIMTAGVGVLAVAGIVYGAVLYSTAEDKADQVNKAVDIIRNVIIGLIAFALMWAGLNFIVPGGVFAP